MDKIVFKVQGSAPEPYIVDFARTGDNLTAHCTCAAGQYGQYCKHRMRILIGDKTGIVSGNIDDIPTIISWLKGTDVEQALQEVLVAIEAVEVAEKKLKGFKKKFARTLVD